MTLCIAAACKHQDVPAIVLCADCRAEKGVAAYSEGRIGSNDAEKIREIGQSFAALLSGVPTKADELLAKCDQAIFTFERTVATEDSDIVITHFFEQLRKAGRLRRQELIDHYVAMHTIFSGREEFLKVGKSSLPESEYSEMLRDIERINLGAEVIVAGFHGSDAIIVRMDALGETHWEDNYSVIGTGSDIALAFLCQNDYSDDMPLPECLFRVYEAKAASQKNRTVGELTSFQVLIQHKGRFDISDNFFEQLKSKRRMLTIPSIETEEGWLESLSEEDSAEAEASNPEHALSSEQ